MIMLNVASVGVLWCGFILSSCPAADAYVLQRPAKVTSLRVSFTSLHVSSAVTTTNTKPVDQRPHEQRTSGSRKARRLNHPFQHLYRHDDPPHYPTFENSTLLESMDARTFLRQYGGYSNEDIDEMNRTFPPLLDLDVMRHLRPKMRFVKYTLGGVEGKEDKEDNMKIQLNDDIMDNVRTLSDLGRNVPPPFFGARLEKTVAPRHAFLQHANLPHGSKLLKENGKLFREFLVSSRRTKQFVAMCNMWKKSYIDDSTCSHTGGTITGIITTEQVEAFDTLFQRGLMSAARNDIETVDSIQHYATLANITSSQLVKLLASAGANPLEKDVRGISLIHWAAGAGNLHGLVELIEFLGGGIDEALEMGADRDGASAIHWAAAGARSKEFGCGGHVDVVRYFLDKCPQEKAKILVNRLTKDGNSVLMWAAWSGTLDVVKLLVRNRGDVTISNRNGCTVAHWAASGGNLEVCKYLHDILKVDFSTQNYAGNTPLSHAVAYGRADIVEWLRNDVCTDDDDGRAENLASDFIGWTDGDSERKKVFDLFKDDEWNM